MIRQLVLCLLWNHFNLRRQIFGDCGYFAKLLDCDFVDALVFSVNKKARSKFDYVEDVNSWEKTTHECHQN